MTPFVVKSVPAGFNFVISDSFRKKNLGILSAMLTRKRLAISKSENSCWHGDLAFWMPFRSAAVSRVLGYGLNPPVENSTCTLRTDTDSKES